MDRRALLRQTSCGDRPLESYNQLFIKVIIVVVWLILYCTIMSALFHFWSFCVQLLFLNDFTIIIRYVCTRYVQIIIFIRWYCTIFVIMEWSVIWLTMNIIMHTAIARAVCVKYLLTKIFQNGLLCLSDLTKVHVVAKDITYKC